jgi:hypothetical protein
MVGLTMSGDKRGISNLNTLQSKPSFLTMSKAELIIVSVSLATIRRLKSITIITVHVLLNGFLDTMCATLL